MDITTNIEIKKEAIFNIVIDEANGDFMNLQGEALFINRNRSKRENHPGRKL